MTDNVAAYSAAMDIALAMLPWKLIWGLNMKREEKIGVAFAMSCGILYVLAFLPPGELLTNRYSAGVTAIVKTTKIPAMLDLDPGEQLLTLPTRSPYLLTNSRSFWRRPLHLGQRRDGRYHRRR